MVIRRTTQIDFGRDIENLIKRAGDIESVELESLTAEHIQTASSKPEWTYEISSQQHELQIGYAIGSELETSRVIKLPLNPESEILQPELVEIIRQIKSDIQDVRL